MADGDSGRLAGQFSLERQLQGNWCWAAIGAALARYFHGSERLQCALVQATLSPHGVDCCQTPDHAQCDRVERISSVLAEVGVPRRAEPPQPEGQVPFATIRADIGRDRPVICLTSGLDGEHYVIVVGWSLEGGVPRLLVDDPSDGYRHRVTYSDFFNFGGRQWVQTTRLA